MEFARHVTAGLNFCNAAAFLANLSYDERDVALRFVCIELANVTDNRGNQGRRRECRGNHQRSVAHLPVTVSSSEGRRFLIQKPWTQQVLVVVCPEGLHHRTTVFLLLQ
jgi:hypothetical protein